jgi:hypothetical protein
MPVDNDRRTRAGPIAHSKKAAFQSPVSRRYTFLIA